MKRIAIDTHIVDKIMDAPGCLAKIQDAGKQGSLIIIGNHIIRDQLSKTPDADRKARLLSVYDALPKTEVPTWGGIWGISQWGMSCWGDGEGSGVAIKDVQTKGRGRSTDALIATTASGEADVLVTEDSDLAKKIGASTARCEVWSFSEFETFVVTCMTQRQEDHP